jgi:hypothetical protein
MTRVYTGVCRSLGAVALCAGLLVSGCGGSEKRGPAQPVSGEGEDEGSGEEGGGSTLISDEDLETVRLYFERKRTVISRCFSDAMDGGEVDEEARELYLTVTVTVDPDGKARNVRFSDQTVRSDSIESCVREHIDKWTLPRVEQTFEYSHRYGFNAL